MCLICIASRGIKSGLKEQIEKYAGCLSSPLPLLLSLPSRSRLSCYACSIFLCMYRCPLLFALSFLGANLSSTSQFAVLLHPANTQPVLSLAPTMGQRSTAPKLRLKCLINIQYARITHSIACSATQCALLLSLSPSPFLSCVCLALNLFPHRIIQFSNYILCHIHK